MTNITKSILRFLLRASLAAISVVSPCIAFYVWLDPFKVIWHYDEYFVSPDEAPCRIGLNKGVVTVNTYLNNLAAGAEPYNSFIFGSSISCYYDAGEWSRLLAGRSDTEIHPFHFDSSSETPVSMARKIEYLYHTGAPLDHALLVLDPIVMGTEEKNSPFSIDPVEIMDDAPYFLKFHYIFFRGAMNADFLKSLIAAKLTGTPANIGHNPIYEIQPIIYNKSCNQETLPDWDSAIRQDPKTFYSRYPLLPPACEVVEGRNTVTEEKAQAFKRIAAIFRECGTDFEVIVSPNRRGVALSEHDRNRLVDIFGTGRVHDFSASYAGYLRCDTMLYDNTHYRPPFALMLMRDVYLEPVQ